MEAKFEFLIVLKLIAAFILGAFIGYDREKQDVDAGIRTYAAICFGATMFTAIADEFKDISAMARVIANIVIGIGFLGAGIITKNDAAKSAHGLTSAATVWCTAAVGVAVGLDMFIIAVVAAFMLYFLLSLDRQRWYKRWKEKVKREKNNGNAL